MLIEKHHERIVLEKERRHITGISTSRWYTIPNRPRAVALGPRARGWVLSELLAFNAERIAERDGRS